MYKLLCFTITLLILISSGSVANPGPGKKCKCDEDAIINRETTDESWNKYIHQACASIQNAEYDNAYDWLDKALKINDDSYIKGLYSCIKSMKESPDYKNVNSSSPAKDAQAQPTGLESEVAKESGAGKEENRNVVKDTIQSPTPGAGTQQETGKAPAAGTEENKNVEPSGKNDVNSSPGDTNSSREPAIASAETPAPADESTNAKEKPRTFTAEELASFQAKGILKVNLLKNYLNRISNKSISMNDGLDAINNAMKLFYGETYVEVSSRNSSKKTNFPTRAYFQRVRALNYDNVEIEWADFEYTSNLRKAPDGNYYGYIKFRQRFKGIKDGRVVYEDITDKVVAVILKAYDKAIEGEKVENFDVFLGDIEVLQTSKD